MHRSVLLHRRTQDFVTRRNGKTIAVESLRDIIKNSMRTLTYPVGGFGRRLWLEHELLRGMNSLLRRLASSSLRCYLPPRNRNRISTPIKWSVRENIIHGRRTPDGTHSRIRKSARQQDHATPGDMGGSTPAHS